MDILLVNPRVSSVDYTNIDKGTVIPLNLAYLASPLIEMGLNVEILDLESDKLTALEFRSFIEENRPGIVGITCITASYSNCLRVAKIVKEVNSESTVVVGGCHVTFTVNETMQCKEIDYVVIGEGEQTFKELVEYIIDGKGAVDEIKGIAFRLHGDIIITKRRGFTKDLDLLLVPARQLLASNKYNTDGKGVVFSGRGCIGSCIFCSEKAMHGSRRFHSISRVMNELRYVKNKLFTSYITFNDETLTSDLKRTEAICEEILKSSLNIDWWCASRVDVEDVTIFEKMSEAGCVTVLMGVESGSDQILKSLRKRITTKQIKQVVTSAIEAGINVVCTFMIGSPDDTRETIEETLSFMNLLKDYGASVDCAVTTPFPGTYLYNRADYLGVKILTNNWDDFLLTNPICSTKNLSLDEIRGLYFDAQEMLDL